MRVAPVSSEVKTSRRVVVASFIAGIGAMLVIGLLAPIAANGGLSLTEAHAQTVEEGAPAIAPLDVEAIEATLADAERHMEANRARTDAALAQLERLAR